MASFLKKALPGVLPPALAANPDLNAAGMNGTVLASIVRRRLRARFRKRFQCGPCGKCGRLV